MWMWIVGVCVLVFVALAIRVVLAFRRVMAKANAEVNAALSALQPEDIPAKAQECIEVVRQKIGVELSIEDWQQSAKALDDLLSDRVKRQAVLKAFERPGISFYAFIPLGAFIGQLFEHHARSVWRKKDGSPFMETVLPNGTVTAWPFEKVQQMCYEHTAGDLVAYIATFVNTDALEAQLHNK